MYRYSGFGLVIDSEVELPELTPAAGRPDVSVRFGPVPRDWATTRVDEEVAFTGLAGAFHIKGGSSITIEPLAGTDAPTLRLLLLGKVMAFLLRQRGWLPLHASGVAIGEHGVLFMGPSGVGKSTTAAAFYARGHKVITDDIGAVRIVGGCPVVQSGFQRIRLLGESPTLLDGQSLDSTFHLDKRIFHLNENGTHDKYPLRRIYLLEPGAGLGLEPLTAAISLTLYSKHTFVRLRNADASLFKMHFRDCASLAAILPVRRLTRPASLKALTQLASLVEQDLER